MSEILIFWLIVSGIAVFASLIHTCIAEGELEPFAVFEDFFDDGVWITFLSVYAIGGVVFGFKYWLWWAMLIILIIVLSAVIFIIVLLLNSSKKDESRTRTFNVTKKEQTKYNCSNCGAKVTKVVKENYFGEERVTYVCEHCGTTYTKSELLSCKTEKPRVETNEKNEETFDLDDWEEEYFEACYRLFFKPYNFHTTKQIDRRQESLQNRLYDDDYIYDDIEEDCQEEVLDEAYDFLEDNEEEIEEYLESNSVEDIKKRFSYYLDVQKNEDEDD